MAAAEGPDATSFTECARGSLDYALSRLTHPDGTLASSEDATGDGFARYYAWTEAEIYAVLGPDSAAFKAAHGVVPGGNVPAADDPSAVFAQRNLLCSTALADPAQGSDASRLLAARDRRGAPPRDERATAAEYGLLINALARAGVQMHEPRYLDAARRLLGIVRKDLMVSQDGTLRRLVGSSAPAYADDYAALALACRGLMLAANDKASGDLSSLFLAQLDARFYDGASGAYFGAPSPAGPGFFMRPASAGDPPSVETLSVLARSPNSGAIAAALLQSLEDSSPQAPGDQLLALALYAKRRS